MNAKSLKKTFGLEIGKTYILGNEEKVTIEGIGRNAYTKATVLFCKSLENGKIFDASVNDAAGWRQGR